MGFPGTRSYWVSLGVGVGNVCTLGLGLLFLEPGYGPEVLRVLAEPDDRAYGRVRHRGV